jgi:hypothetical protein
MITVDAEKVFDKSQHLFMIKVLKKIKIEESYLSIPQAIHDKHIAKNYTK